MTLEYKNYQSEEPLYLNGEKIPQKTLGRTSFFHQLKFTMFGAFAGGMAAMAIKAFISEQDQRGNKFLKWLLNADHPTFAVENEDKGLPYRTMGRVAWVGSIAGWMVDMVKNIHTYVTAVLQSAKRDKMLKEALKADVVVKLTNERYLEDNIFAQVPPDEVKPRPPISQRIREEQSATRSNER